MATLLFVHDSPFEYPGVLSLSGYLQSKGHTVEVLVESCEGAALWDKAREIKPDWVGFSSIFSRHHQCYRLAREAREKLGVGTVFGGPYVSYFPQAIQHEEVDVIIRGEAEESLLLFLDSHDRGEDYVSLPSIVTKRNGQVLANPPHPLESNLDKYPIPNRSIYYKYSHIRNAYHKQFMSGRGCPYNCYFCFNQEFRKLYDIKGKELLRRHSPERMIEELAQCKSRWPVKRLVFNDDIFILDPAWLEVFLPRYKKEINVPFGCQARVEMVTDRIARLLGMGGCHHVMIGLESGNTRVRHQIMGKTFSNEQFLRAADLLHKYGVKVTAYNILGCPTETLDEALDTVRLNARAKVDYPWFGLYNPHPGTQTDAIARAHGYLDSNFTVEEQRRSVFGRSLLKQPQIREVERVHKFFYLGAKMPWFIPVIRRVVRYNLGPIYTLIFLITYFIRYVGESGASLWQAILFSARNLKHY
ncbi:MAG: radical SAM protein [Candidatus Zixiibacteriota bacterium]|nr:MAG: radical SAM protein [candidate division Zixibacteria bacterium]